MTAITAFYIFYSRHEYINSQNDKFTIRVGETVDIRLYENGSTGYINCWLNEKKCKYIKLISREYVSSLNEKLGYNGSGGIIKFTFIGTSVGLDTIKLSRCPTAIEHKNCEDFSDDSTEIDNEFIITVKK